MENYDWEQYKDLPWLQRYPTALAESPTVRGIWEWREYIRLSAERSRTAQFDWLPADLEYSEKIDIIKGPRVFISHRQSDYPIAKDVADIATASGYRYWLDIEDPFLKNIDCDPYLTEAQKSIVTASIVELALLNCTHVLAVITRCTRGSLWVPYEYGRVKLNAPSTYNASCLTYLNPFDDDFPEYLLLNPVCTNDIELRDWFDQNKPIP